MTFELSLAAGGRLALRRDDESLVLSADRRILRLSRNEAWRLAEWLDRLATAAADD